MTRNSEPSIVAESDSELLRQFVSSHDEPALNALVLRHGPMVLGICRRILRGQSDADDAFQATFLLLALKGRQINQPQLLGNWLFGVATRTSIGIRRSNRRRVVQEKRLMRILRPRQRDETKDADLRMMLDEQISKLPEKLRRVIVCCHLEGLTKREAAERLKINDSTIMQRLKQAREILKRRLGARGAGLTEASLGTMLVALAVPAALSSGTVKAATVAASGKAAAAGVATGKAAGFAKGGSSGIFAAKVKLAASLLLATGLAVTGAATVAPLVASAPQASAVPATQPAQPPDNGQTPLQKREKRIHRLILAIVVYEQRGKMPPDLKTMYFNDPDVDYFGMRGVDGIRLDTNVAIIAEHLAPDDHGPIILGFADAHTVIMSQVLARQRIEYSKKAIENAAWGKKAEPEVLAPSTRNATGEPMPVEIQNALEKNATDLSPVSIAWSKTGFSKAPLAEAIAQFHVTANYFNTGRTQVCWQSGKWYDRVEQPSGSIYEAAFDGSGWGYVIQGKKPRIERTSTDEMYGDGTVVDMPYLERAGIHLPTNGPQMRAHVALSTILLQLQNGATLTKVETGPAPFDGHLYTKLTVIADNEERRRLLHSLPADRMFIYYLDPTMNYAIRREEQRYDQTLLETTDNEQFEQLQGRDVWLPHHSTSRYYTTLMTLGTYFPEPILGETFEVTDLQQQSIDDDRFVLKLPAGATQPEPAAPLPPSNMARTGVLAGVQTAAPAPMESSSWRWIVAGIACVGAIVLVVFGIRRYRGATR